jgi:hypothetical protein
VRTIILHFIILLNDQFWDQLKILLSSFYYNLLKKQIVFLAMISLILIATLTMFILLDEHNDGTTNTYSKISCYPSDESKINRCLASYNCLSDESNANCIEKDQNYLVSDICSDASEIIVRESDGCFILPKVGTTVCGKYSFSVDTEYECKLEQ